MKTLVPYFTLNGRADEALDFYAESFGGEIIFIQRYSETTYKVSEKFNAKIAHAEFKADGIHLYLSDGYEEFDATLGNGLGMTVNFDNAEEQMTVLEKLKRDGKVTSELFETTINTRLITLIDKFGIHWYLNYRKPKHGQTNTME